MTEALRFWALLEVIGLGAAPLAGLVLARLPGAGLGLGKPLGLLLVTWLVWLGGSSTLIPYGTVSAALWIALVCALGLLIWRRGPRGPGPDPLRTRLFWGAEAVFLVGFAAMALVVAFAPDVWNTEKPMDMAFLNASNRAGTFPPHDPWLAGAELNYYYLGQLAMGVLVKLTAVAPDHGYNLSLAALFGLTAAGVFTLGGTLWAAAGHGRGAVRAGLAAVGLIVVAGNLEGARLLLSDGGPLRDYDWFGASRVIPDTITEFPWFSFLLGDLHAHVLALPFTLLALAFALQVVLAGPGGWLEGAVAALATAFLYAVNSWSYPVMAGLLVLAVLVWLRDPRSAGARAAALRWLLLVLAGGVLLVLPFLLSFDPAARGIGLVEDGGGLVDTLLVVGTLLTLVAVAYAARLRAWVLVAALVAGALLAVLGWADVALLAALLVVALWALLADRGSPDERLVWLLVTAGVACLLGPELLYVRDEFDGSDLYRMNTVFKLDYQAWLLLGLAGIGALAHWRAWLRTRALRLGFAGLIAVVAIAGAVYPIAGTYARTGGFARSPTLDGLGWLRERAPGDVAAIDWLNDHVDGAPVVLEAVGDDYSAFGHGRISTFTGLPTVLGWPGHERQWGHDAGDRAAQVARAYTSPSAAAALPILRAHDVRYVVVGPLERTDYGDGGVAKWDELGRRVFDRDGTTVWELRI